jgi:hypothetical protein
MKIRSVTIGDVLIVLLIASPNGNHKTGQLHYSNASASNNYIKSPQNSNVASSTFQLKKRTPLGNERSHIAFERR